MQTRAISRFYGLLCIIYLISQSLPPLSWLLWVLKPLLVPTLLLLVVRAVNRPLSAFYQKTCLALFFGWLGDVLLMFAHRGEIWFLLGLGAFLVGHVFYILVFLQTPKPPNYLRRHPFSAWPIVAFAVLLLVVLVPHVGHLWLPITIYALVIMTMSLFALHRKGQVAASSFVWVFVGAILFMISDGLIAINKFVIPFPASAFFIMSTYMAAQYLITIGLIRQTVKSI